MIDRWCRLGKSIENTPDGAVTTITYAKMNSDVPLVQSVRKPIPHANRGGCWMNTSYYIVGSNKEYASLTRAKEAAELIAAGKEEKA